jgi:hypothetical protein
LRHADWTFHGVLSGDNYQFLMTTAIGKPSHANTFDFRFWPLGLCDYSILLLIPHGTTALAHYIYTCVMMILASVMLVAYLSKITNNDVVSLIALLTLFSASGFMQIHMNCFYAERMLFFMLSAFMLCRHKAQIMQSTGYYVLAFLSAVYATYLKEPTFGAVAIIATTSLVVGKLSKKDKTFNYLLLINSMIFIANYWRRLLVKHYEKIYATVKANILDSASGQFHNEPLLYFIICLAIIRAYNIFFKKDTQHITTDSLLFAGCWYAFAYTLLRLTWSYYLVPAIVLFIPAFALFLSNSKTPTRCVALGLVAISTCGSITYSKNLIMSEWEHRRTDHLFFEHLVNECQSGKKLYWLSDKWLEENDPEYRFLDGVMCWDRYQDFIDYYSGFSCKLKRVFDFDKFAKDSLILCGVKTIQSGQFSKIYHKLTKMGFKKINEFNGSFKAAVFSSGAVVFAHD